MQTEKATLDPDLPHNFIADRGHPDSECRCGREKAHDLHTVWTPETAAHTTALVTEKGA